MRKSSIQLGVVSHCQGVEPTYQVLPLPGHGQEIQVDRLSPENNQTKYRDLKINKLDFPDIRVFKKGSKIAKSCEEPS